MPPPPINQHKKQSSRNYQLPWGNERNRCWGIIHWFEHRMQPYRNYPLPCIDKNELQASRIYPLPCIIERWCDGWTSRATERYWTDSSAWEFLLFPQLPSPNDPTYNILTPQTLPDCKLFLKNPLSFLEFCFFFNSRIHSITEKGCAHTHIYTSSFFLLLLSDDERADGKVFHHKGDQCWKWQHTPI